MSTNYYITHRRALADSVPTEWLQKVHIAQYAAGGFLLQTIRGEKRFSVEDHPSNVEEIAASSFYWSPVHSLDTVENWTQLKALICNSDFTVIDEYGAEIKTADFINMVENQDNGTDYRYHRMTDWLESENSIYAVSSLPRTDYIDRDGYVFEMKEFS